MDGVRSQFLGTAAHFILSVSLKASYHRKVSIIVTVIVIVPTEATTAMTVVAIITVTVIVIATTVSTVPFIVTVIITVTVVGFLASFLLLQS